MAPQPLFPRAYCPFAIPTSNAERYRPYLERGRWNVITGAFQVGSDYGVLREGGTAEHILLHTIAGEGFAVTEVGWERVPPGRTLLIEPHQPHYYATVPDIGVWKFQWVHVFPPSHWHFLRELPRRLPGLRVADAAEETVRRRIQRALREAHALRQRLGPSSDALAINALERALLWALEGGDGRQRPDVRIQRAIDAVLATPEVAPSVAELAKLTGLSPSRFAHLFREQSGETPQQFVERVRLETASEWLRVGGRTISEISDDLGFSSPFYFSRRFKARFGFSPSRCVRSAEGAARGGG